MGEGLKRAALAAKATREKRAAAAEPGPEAKRALEATAWQERQTSAAEAALDAHERTFRLEAGMEPATKVWHLVCSLLAYCDVNGVDFDEQVSLVRQDVAQGLL